MATDLVEDLGETISFRLAWPLTVVALLPVVALPPELLPVVALMPEDA